MTLAERAVACKGWRWMPGMMRLRVTPPEMRDHLRREGRVPDAGDDWSYNDWPVIPDLTDPATLGCLLALVREAWGEDTWVQHEDEWTCWVVLGGQLNHHIGATEAEALVAAWEAAP